MTSLIERFSSNKQGCSVSSKSSQNVKQPARKKLQAQKNRSDQAVEIVWIQHLVAAMLAHKVRVAVLVLVLMLFGLPLLMAQTQWLPIEKIVLTGRFVQLNTDELEQKLKPFLGEGFFSVDIKGIQSKLAQQPWVEKVSVRRVWPDRLNVMINEKQAVARWDGENLLSDLAVIFKQDSKGFETLPKINGYKEQSADLLTRYRNLQSQFLPLGLNIDEMSEDSKGATSLLLNEQLRVNLGSDNNEEKIRHLLAVYQKQIQPESEHIKYIDFRYSNGFAIAWKKDYLEQRAKAQKRGNRNV